MQLHTDQLFFKMGEISTDGYFVYHAVEEEFSYLNAAFATIWQEPLEDILRSPNLLFNHIHPEDLEHAKSCYEECLEDLRAKKYEFRLLIEDREKYIRITVYPFQENGNVFLCGTVDDTTVIRHNKIHIEQINARKNVALEVLSHDLKEPLGLMKITASAIEKEIATMGNSNVIESVKFIKDMCERNIKLVRSIINHEFAKSAVIELEKERTDIVWEINDVIRTYRRSHLRDLKDFRFTSSHDKIYLQLDGMKFLQVINNLISNAIKFTPVGGIIDIHVKDQESSVSISVADNGIGIPEEFKPGLFDLDKETFRTGLNGEESGGLGMNIIKSIIELHDGKLSFESKQNVGTTFYIELPKQNT